jgi:hypothetical protein
VVIAAFFFMHHGYGLTYPVPWPDECSFLWPALAFRDTGTLHARELFEPREVLWMPPGYMVLSGAIFKLTGFSLPWARWLSAIYLAAALACLASLLRARRARLGHVILIGIFALSPIATLAGNAARMETLVCLLILGGLTLLCSAHYVAGLAVLALAVLVHPNALFALLAGLAFAATRGMRALKPERWELGLVVLAALCWAAYAIHVATHWDDFVTDFGSQLAWKRAEFSMSGGVSARLVKPAVMVVSLLLALGWAGALRFARHALPFAFFASGLLLQVLLTTGWLYDLYAALLYLLVAILGVEVMSALVTTELAERPASARIAAMLAVVAVMAAGLLFGLTRDSFANQSPEYVRTHAKTESSVYVRDSDRAAVSRALRSLPKPVTVQFLPDGDSLLFHDVRSSGLRFSQASFYETRADAYVYHDSIWLHPFVRGLMQGRLAMRQGIGVPIDRWRVLASRAGTDRWLLYQRERPRGLP